MYVDPNFRTKKALKQAVADGQVVTVFSPGPFGCLHPGRHAIEGPHYPQPHKWYAEVETDADGRVVRIIS